MLSHYLFLEKTGKNSWKFDKDKNNIILKQEVANL